MSVRPWEREIMPGVVLRASTMGGYSVIRQGEYIGWIHASAGDRWNAYVRRPGVTGEFVGRLRQDDAVRAIVTAYHATS